MNKRVMVALIAILSLMLVGSASAENPVEKGKILMAGGWTGNFAIRGGDLHKDADDNSETYFQLNPCVAYGFADGFFLGALLEFERTSQGDASQQFIGAGPKLYWFPTAANADDPKGKIVPFLAGMFVFGQHKVDYDNVEARAKPVAINETLSKQTAWAARFEGGGIWMLMNSWGVHGNAYFELQNVKQTVSGGQDIDNAEGVSGNEFGIMLGVTGFFDFVK